MCRFLPTCMSVALQVLKGHWIPRLRTVTLMLGFKSKSSRRDTSSLNYCIISLDHKITYIIVLKDIILKRNENNPECWKLQIISQLNWRWILITTDFYLWIIWIYTQSYNILQKISLSFFVCLQTFYLIQYCIFVLKEHSTTQII